MRWIYVTPFKEVVKNSGQFCTYTELTSKTYGPILINLDVFSIIQPFEQGEIRGTCFISTNHKDKLYVKEDIKSIENLMKGQ